MEVTEFNIFVLILLLRMLCVMNKAHAALRIHVVDGSNTFIRNNKIYY